MFNFLIGYLLVGAVLALLVQKHVSKDKVGTITLIFWSLTIWPYFIINAIMRKPNDRNNNP